MLLCILPVSSDYRPVSSHFDIAGFNANGRTVSIFIINDFIGEDTETFLLQLSSDDPDVDIVGTNTTLVVIEDDDERKCNIYNCEILALKHPKIS